METASYEFIGEIAKEQLNGKQEVKPTLADNRLRLDVDPKKVRAWEVAVLQTGELNDCMMIFARYLVQGDRPVSPNLPAKPLRKLTGGERSQIRNSRAYELLEEFDLHTLQQASKSFTAQAQSILDDPN